ncbi:putative GMC-type oxidoreductase [Acanthamoeba castellanii mimivirus]|uniref:Putative GMC-type oxidoreductase L128 n=5 Tax=Mimivirus TaxID=315393 RepID=YL128_MIMIV|nr:putative GMC-type oxidoreductase [Acanthamoeba polyphaga mimivirus]Q5UPK7.1 RecName: Full=Putative GMC-type oxidoreductase L128; Flags: Precursor [Acanthamoeba polyphaga mimivirus]ALR83639.1 putative GMC-type oxidoreductase [Niemeyer virus]AMK61775.1 GMC-type oxidoreductase [Samba virus]AMZ02576.1 putative GMC-type oxidoreductase [Mimivirus Bombay]BAV61213.1 putative GMC-type oxidoreductase [Acanthamoeba castellanii mimivirus]AAV50403.1 choline dehydrogenase [Acanthamoeba polyphaga mimivir
MTSSIVLKFFLIATLLVIANSLPACHNGQFLKINKGPNCDDAKYENPDYVIVGGGAAGSVLLDKCISYGYKCTLIERGIDYEDEQVVSQPSGSGLVQSSNAVLLTTTYPNSNIFNKTLVITEPNIIGGSTSINGEISVFTDIENFFEEISIPGWSYLDVLPYYLNVTNSVNRPSHQGAVDVTNTLVTDPKYVAFKAAIQQVFPNIHEKLPDMNTASLNGGFPGYGPPETSVKTSFIPIGDTQVPVSGFRESAYRAYIHPIRNHPNVRIMLRSRVDKVAFDKCGETAKKVFVTYQNYQGSDSQCELKAKKGIILSAGALRTPQILMQSGVGPADHLNELGIPVVSDMPDVGQHLDDHPTVVRTFLGIIPDSSISANIDGHAYWNHLDDPNKVPNWSIQISGFYGPNFKNILNVYMDQMSRGWIKLRSTDPADTPIFNLGHFSDLEDVGPASLGFNKTNQVISNLQYIPIPGLTDVVCPSFIPNCQSNLTEYYMAAYYQFGYSGYHYTGTCAFEKVVDPNTGLVYGFDNLYVVDASVFPKAPRGNTQIGTYAISAKLADIIFGCQ